MYNRTSWRGRGSVVLLGSGHWRVLVGGVVQPTPFWNAPSALLAVPKCFSLWELPVWIAEGAQGKHQKGGWRSVVFFRRYYPRSTVLLLDTVLYIPLFLSPPQQKPLAATTSFYRRNIFTCFARQLICLPFCRASLKLISWIFCVVFMSHELHVSSPPLKQVFLFDQLFTAPNFPLTERVNHHKSGRALGIVFNPFGCVQLNK